MLSTERGVLRFRRIFFKSRSRDGRSMQINDLL